jgi:SAM-dependent methyltransferase
VNVPSDLRQGVQRLVRSSRQRLARQPDPTFDPAQYLAANPDVADSGIDPTEHYQRYGRAEGRPLRPTTTATSPAGPPPRVRMSWHLVGDGVELGPGHNPYPLPLSGVAVSYVDRWVPEENQALFPELGSDAHFPKPDICANFDADGLAPIADGSQDFVIASHVLEHLANPLAMLGEVHRVLRPGGVLLLLLPDMRRTFDAPRAVTPLDHLIDEFDRGVDTVSDEHIVEFITSTSPGEVPADEAAWPAVIDKHRLRSIHVHCWTEHDFPEVLDHAIRNLGQRWELVELAGLDDGGPDSIEFGYLLRKSATSLRETDLAERFAQLHEAMSS